MGFSDDPTEWEGPLRHHQRHLKRLTRSAEDRQTQRKESGNNSMSKLSPRCNFFLNMAVVTVTSTLYPILSQPSSFQSETPQETDEISRGQTDTEKRKPQQLHPAKASSQTTHRCQLLPGTDCDRVVTFLSAWRS
ncbi:hypothetical protein ACOMHN_008788 [Nucella lapillus]